MQQSPEIVEELRRFYFACAAGDVPACATAVANEPGVLMIGTDPGEWWDDHATIVRNAETQMAALGGAFPLSAGAAPVAYRDGAIGWAADEPHLVVPDGTRVPLRLTAVFRAGDDGAWRIVQAHFSQGAPNEQLVGPEIAAAF